MTDVTPDQKPRKRIIDSAAQRVKLDADPNCRVCSDRATDPHHILLKSQGGDDIEDNIMPLCFDCHRRYHNGKVNLWLKPKELIYILDRMGREKGIEYLKRRRIEWS